MTENEYAFSAAVETHDPAALAAVLHPDVVFRSPAVFKPYAGRDAAMFVLQGVLAVFEDFQYVLKVRDGQDEVLRFKARVAGREIDGVDILRYDDDGLVVELSVMIRPLSALQTVAEAMGAKLADMMAAAEGAPSAG